MNQNFNPKPHKDTDQSQFQLPINNVNSQKALTNVSNPAHPLGEKATELLPNNIETENILNVGNAQLEIAPENDVNLQKQLKPFNIKIVTALASAVVMLPILALGTATYYFGNQAVNKQTTLARRADPTGISEKELSRQKQLLATLLIGTGITSLLAGLIAAFLAHRNLRSVIAFNTAVLKATTEPKHKQSNSSLAKFIDYLNQSFDRESILTSTVEEAQRLLECDRVVIYKFDNSNYGEVVAEAVIPGCIKAIGLKIQDSCFEADYKEKYRDGRVKILDNIDGAGLDSCYVEKLQKLDIKANLVAPIIHQEKLFGLLAAHQCTNSRTWQPDEIELLTRLAQRVGFSLDSNELLAESKLLKTQSATETHWTQCFIDAVKHIHQSLQEQDILDASVEKVHRVLDCDRVVVYSLNQDNQGVIIAESVTPGWTRALGTTIEDPCFEARYIEKYQDGRVRALNNIYEEEMMACYLAQLEKLEVKANLVTPIINEGKLFGLLVAHQCANPRHWQQQEITWLTQIATQVGFALDNAKLNAKLLVESTQLTQQQEKEVQWTDFFTDAVQHIRQSLQQKDVLDISVKEVRRVLNCDRVVIYSLNQDSYGIVIAESVAPGWTKALGITIKDPCFEARYLEQFQNGRVRALNNIYEAGITACYLEQLEKLEVKANLVTPVINEGKLFGILVAHQCAHPRNWQQHEIRWVTQIATQVGFALDNAKLLIESSQLKQQAEIETQWAQFFTNAVRHIRKSLQQQDILAVSVEEVYRVLDCDRVVIYSLNQEKYGVVIAESVAPGWKRALGITIKDPCFEARYLKEYQNGRVRPLDNVYQADITPCYLEQLEKLEVKANLVIPIINENNLFGLLVAHQCSGPRNWQQHEIRWVTQIATQVGFALDNAKLLKQSANRNLPAQLPLPPRPSNNLGRTQAVKEVSQENLSVEKAPQTQHLPQLPLPPRPSNNFGKTQAVKEVSQENLSVEKTPQTQHLPKTPNPSPKIDSTQQEVHRLLLDSKDAFEHLWLGANQQSDQIVQFLIQMQTVNDFVGELMAKRQTPLPQSAIAELDQTTQTKINEISFRKKLAQVEDKVTQATQKIKQINHVAQKLSQIGKLIGNFGQQMKQQATDFSIKVDKLGESNQSSLVSIAERVESLTNRLTTQATQITTVIEEIAISVPEIVKSLNFQTKDIFAENNLEQTNQSLLQPNTKVNSKLKTLTGKITQVVENTQNLAFMNQFILQISDLANQELVTIAPSTNEYK